MSQLWSRARLRMAQGAGMVLGGLVVTCLAAVPALAASATVTVSPSGLATYTPAAVNINVGDTVTWHGTGTSVAGQVDFGDPTTCTSDGTFSAPSGGFGSAWTASRTFTSAGTYSYFDDALCVPGSSFGAPWVGTVVVAAPSGGGTTGNTSSAGVSASVAVSSQFKSVTVSASSETFGTCSGGSSSGSTLGYPNGRCQTPNYTVTNNGSVPEGIDVAGADATASDAGTGWTLVGGTGTPGQDQFQLSNSNGQNLTTTPQCDIAVPGCSSGTQNSLGPNVAFTDALHITGPSAASDAAATSFSTAVTYTAI